MKDQFTDYNKQPVIDKYEEPRNIFVSIQSVKNMCTNKLELHIKSQFMAKVGFCDWYSDGSFSKIWSFTVRKFSYINIESFKSPKFNITLASSLNPTNLLWGYFFLQLNLSEGSFLPYLSVRSRHLQIFVRVKIWAALH